MKGPKCKGKHKYVKKYVKIVNLTFFLELSYFFEYLELFESQRSLFLHCIIEYNHQTCECKNWVKGEGGWVIQFSPAWLYVKLNVWAN